ncbi:hypothetical protein ASF79_14700 [Agreia sp. Leaf335]|uniref:GrpB family protein n=1 Tax=Agreia sp. Leaf335 TaxID=1736340 RepID=UPI0006FE19AC|nr:GrpB family protein [Agreia sp. Leaf335]KQR18948.1 hypothetical protein ASF79_14700 [Agreia sp. Leaf335]
MPSTRQITEFSDEPAAGNPWVVEPMPATIELVEYDPAWPTQARQIGDRLSELLGLRAIRIDHVGSTAVEGLPAKPVIDIDVTVADPADEAGYVSRLQEAGFVLTVREPWWHEHRLFRGGRRSDDRVAPTDGGPATNIHIFGPDSPEPIKHLVFRNWLRASASDRKLYADTKRAAAAAQRDDDAVMDYNARKQTVILDIYERAFRASGFLS